MSSESSSSSSSSSTSAILSSASFPTALTSPLISVDVQLDGCATYKLWAASIQLQLFAHQLWGHIDGTTPCPPSTDSNYSSWINADRRVIGTISQTVNPSIRLQILRLMTGKSITSKELWEYLGGQYEQTNRARSYSVFQELCTARQQEKSIQDFYNYMQDLWHQFYSGQINCCSTCVACSCYKKQRELYEQQQLFQFLMALRPEFETIRGQLLYRVPLPTLEVAISELMAEETRIRILKLQSSDPAAALITQATRPFQSEIQNNYKFGYSNEVSKGKKFCKYCKKIGHVVEECRKLQYNKQVRAHQMHHVAAPAIASSDSDSQSSVLTTSAPSQFSAELINQLAEQVSRQLGSSSAPMTLSPSVLSACLSSTSTYPTSGSANRSADWYGSSP